MDLHAERRRSELGLALGVLVLGVAISAAGAWRLHREIEVRASDEFKRSASRAMDEVRLRFSRTVYGLNGVKGMYAANDNINRAQFRAYVQSRDLAQEFPGTLDTGHSAFSKAVELAAKRLAKSYNNTTAKLLKSALNDGLTAGEDFSQLAARVQRVYEYSNKIRARMVAHNEAFYIANKGSLEAYRQSGVVKTIRWYTAEDERVCEFCGPAHGKVIGVNETFYAKGETLAGRDGGKLDLTYRTIDVPPLHVDCRCFIRAEQIEVT